MISKHLNLAICALFAILPAISVGAQPQSGREMNNSGLKSLTIAGSHAWIEPSDAKAAGFLAQGYDREDYERGRRGWWGWRGDHIPDRDHDRYEHHYRRSGTLLPEGIEPTELTDSRDILRTIVTGVEAAVNKGGLDNLVDEIVEADRDRIGNYPNQRFDEMSQILDRFQRSWERRYNRDLDVRGFSRPLYRNFTYIEQGRIFEPRRVRDWPLDPTRYFPVPKTSPRRDERDTTNLTRGREVAILVIAPRLGLPRLTVSMIHEEPDHWRIDIPDNIGGRNLNRNLMEHVIAMIDDRDRWPEDPDLAYQMVAQHVLMALYGVPAR